MSNAIYTDGKQKVYCNVGPNGSLDIALALLFAGYGLSRLPGNDRVINWIKPMSGCTQADGTPFYSVFTRADLGKLVAINTNNCTWVELEPLLNKQLHKLPAELDALVRVYLILHVLYSDVDAIGAGLVKAVDPVIHRCTEMVSESCWYPKMRKFADVFQVAAENNQAVRFS